MGRREIGPELCAWRARCGVSRLDLAIRAGTTQRHLSSMEQGRSSPGRTIAARLAESLERTLADRNALLLATRRSLPSRSPARHSREGEPTLITTLMSFATALDVTLAGLRLEAFLPADAATARILHHRQAARRAS